MKDRVGLDQWPWVWWSKVVEDFPKLSRETKLFLGKVINLCHDKLAEGHIDAPTGSQSIAPAGEQAS
jgi:hypothetical protein